MPKVAISYCPAIGGSSVVSLQKSFKHVGAEIVDADFRKMMAEIPEKKFDELYSSPEGRLQLFAHAKAKAIELLNDVDCLALPGNNAMIDPELFNQERDVTQPYDFSRTIIELALVHVATEKGMPILGACGGHQVVAVYGGGEITDLNSDQLNKQSYMNYDTIRINKDTMLAQIVGLYLDTEENKDKPYLEGQFFGAHSQRVSKVPTGFIASSIASDDVTIESLESVHGVPIVTTQFHPEIGAKGLPESSFIYRRTKHDRDMNMKVFEFMNTAAVAYNQKKSVMDELKQFKLDGDANIKPSDVKKALAERKLDNDLIYLPTEEKPKKTSYAWILHSVLSIAAGLAATVGVMTLFPLALLGTAGALGLTAVGIGAGLLMGAATYGFSQFAYSVCVEIIGPFIASGMRGSIATGMTAFLVNELKVKEEAAASAKNDANINTYEQEPDQNTKYGTLFDQKGSKKLNPTPHELLRDVKPKVWTEETTSNDGVELTNGEEIHDDSNGLNLSR